MTVDRTPPQVAFDPFDADQVGQPLELFADMRAKCPVAELPNGMYYVSRHEDVLSVFKDTHSFANRDASRAPGVEVDEDERFISELDPPTHPRLRRVLLTILSPAHFAAAEPFIRRVCRDLVDAIVARGEADLVEDFAIPIPSRVVTHILGFPPEDAPRFAHWVNDMLNSNFIEYNRTERGEGFEASFPEFSRYIDDAVASRAREADPPDDLVTRLVQADYDGRPLTLREIRAIAMSVISAGNGTTTSLISSLFHTLVTEPRVFEALAADRALVPLAVEESLRRDPPVVMITRRCTRPVEISSMPLEPGARIALGMISANHDETVYPNPEEFRLDRSGQPPHVTFGSGAHLCLGAALARLETVIAVNAFLDRVAKAELVATSPPEPMQSPVLMGYRSLRVRIVAASETPPKAPGS